MSPKIKIFKRIIFSFIIIWRLYWNFWNIFKRAL